MVEQVELQVEVEVVPQLQEILLVLLAMVNHLLIFLDQFLLLQFLHQQ